MEPQIALWFRPGEAILNFGVAIMVDPARNGSPQRAEFGALHRKLQASLLDARDRQFASANGVLDLRDQQISIGNK
jgi:hypothetical protein